MRARFSFSLVSAIVCTAVMAGQSFVPAPLGRNQTIFWGAECVLPDGSGLAFGGNDPAADDGCARTRIRDAGAWKPIYEDLRAKNPLQKHQATTWGLRTKLMNLTTHARSVFFQGLPSAEELKLLQANVLPPLETLTKDLDALVAELSHAQGLQEYEAGQVKFAWALLTHTAATLKPLATALAAGDTAGQLKTLREVQIELEQAAEACDAEPPARALSPIAFDEKTKLFVVFGGDHLDYLTNDTWVFDPAKQKWFQKHPANAPTPRANQQLKAAEPADGKITLTGGYQYTSTTDYMGGQYRDVKDTDWVYDLAANMWTGGQGESASLRTYRKDPYLPEFFMQGEKPDAAANEAKLKALPLNTWVLTKPPKIPKQNRDWGTMTIAPDRDLLLFWSGGHCAHGGSDVLHYHLSTNRWELAYPVEFPLGQTYSNTSYPDTFNFNRRPWVTGHTYLNYVYDTLAGKLLFVGHFAHCYVYDPDCADWIGRSLKPPGMKYGDAMYTLNCCATPQGAVCWTREGRVFRFAAAASSWNELKLNGKLIGSTTDTSTNVYDAKRDRMLAFASGYGQKYNGQVHGLDFKTLTAAALSPPNMGAPDLAGIGLDRACYDPEHDLVLFGTLLPADAGGFQPTPAFDCAGNRWVALKLNYDAPMRGDGKKNPLTPRGHSSGMAFDPGRKLIWGVDAACNVYVLKLDVQAASLSEIKIAP